MRASVTGAASVVGVAAAAGAAYGIQRAMQPSDLIIITTPAATPSATPMTTINVGKQESIHQIAADLEAAVGSPGDDAMAALINALPPEANGNPEGWVIAGDYTFDAGTNLQAAAVQLMGMLVTQLEAYDVPRDEWADTVVKASIIQAEAAVPNQLIGATDVDALPVTEFWAVIPGTDPNIQCVSVSGAVKWFYGTAHTLSDGAVATLNNGTGALSSVQTNTCNGGSNAGNPCTTGAQCPLGRCGGPTVECASGARSAS